MADSRPGRPLTAVGALTTVGGVLLLVWWVRRIGIDDIRAGFAQVGWGLAWIVLLGGVQVRASRGGVDALDRTALSSALQ